MDLSYLVCSTLRCESDSYSSAINLVVDDTQQLPPGVVESSYSEGSLNSDQVSSSSQDASSASRKKLLSGHTSPSSLALRRRPPGVAFYLKQQTSASDITATSNDRNTIASLSLHSSSSQKKNSNMAIACTAISSNDSQSQRGLSGVRKSSNGCSAVKKSKLNSRYGIIEKNVAPQQVDPFSCEKFCVSPSPLRSKAWSEPCAEEYQVRSKGYMTNRMKEPSKKSAFRLITVDLVNSKTPIHTGLCAQPGERVQLALERERKTGIRELPEFVFAVNLCIPGERIYHAVFYYGVDKTTMEEIRSGQTAFGRIMKQFIFGNSDSYRNKSFKLIPRIVEGNYMVRKGVGSKPAILGKKIKQYYVRGGGVSDQADDRYFEIIVDISSDPVAKRITKLCLGYIKTIVVEMMFALEGSDESTLPERIFGGATIKNLDFINLDGKRTVTQLAQT